MYASTSVDPDGAGPLPATVIMGGTMTGGVLSWDLATNTAASMGAGLNGLLIGGTFSSSVVPYGAACSGSGGNNELVADALPWTSSTFKATGSGLAPLSLLAVDAGFAPLGPLSLASLGIPAAGPGYMLHLDPVYFEFGFTTQGSYTWHWEIDNDPVFAGIGVHVQFVVFEVDPALNLIETTSTNALELTIGSF